MSDSPQRWLELSGSVGRDGVEAAEDGLLAAGALSVTLADAADAPVLEPGPGETPLWPRVTVTGLFDATRDPLELVAAVSAAVPEVDWALRSVADREWTREWMRDFRPMRFGERLWVVPSGMEAPGNGVVVRLDPGLAFGTGTHPTTALCLEWLDGLARTPPGLAGKLVLDYGTGSGVLAIAALRLGAERAVAVDNDPQALLATRENARANGVAGRIEACTPAQADRALGGRKPDLLVANILAGVLARLAPELAALVAPRGRIALSGILAGQEGPVQDAFRPWFDMGAPASRSGWLRLDGRRTEDG